MHRRRSCDAEITSSEQVCTNPGSSGANMACNNIPKIKPDNNGEGRIDRHATEALV